MESTNLENESLNSQLNALPKEESLDNKLQNTPLSLLQEVAFKTNAYTQQDKINGTNELKQSILSSNKERNEDSKSKKILNAVSLNLDNILSRNKTNKELMDKKTTIASSIADGFNDNSIENTYKNLFKENIEELKRLNNFLDKNIDISQLNSEELELYQVLINKLNYHLNSDKFEETSNLEMTINQLKDRKNMKKFYIDNGVVKLGEGLYEDLLLNIFSESEELLPKLRKLLTDPKARKELIGNIKKLYDVIALIFKLGLDGEIPKILSNIKQQFILSLNNPNLKPEENCANFSKIVGKITGECLKSVVSKKIDTDEKFVLVKNLVEKINQGPLGKSQELINLLENSKYSKIKGVENTIKGVEKIKEFGDKYAEFSEKINGLNELVQRFNNHSDKDKIVKDFLEKNSKDEKEFAELLEKFKNDPTISLEDKAKLANLFMDYSESKNKNKIKKALANFLV